MNQNPNLIPLRQFATMADARAECARLGITPAYGVLSRRMVTMIRNQPKASIPGSVRRRMQREAARQ